MLNNRLGTQPLDPSILLRLEANNNVAKTQPLLAAANLLNPGLLGDAFSQPPASNGKVPAQSGSVREALKPIEMKPLSAPMGAPGLAFSSGSALSDTEATLLLDLSAKLGDLRQQSPINFSQAVSALQKLNLSGTHDFSQLTTTQQSVLRNVGITPENSENLLGKLYQVILPESSGNNTSNSFQQAKNSLNSFFSGLNLREQAMSVIRNSEDLNQMAQLVDGLSAGGISSLLADKAIVVNDIAVGEINSKNFQITTPMDFTVGQVFVNAQKAPAKLDGVADILQKVKQSQGLNRDETLLLGEYGLFVNKSNQLQTMNSDAPMPAQSIAQLEKMLSTVKSSSNTDMYNQVIGQSIQLLQSSDQYMALSEQARAMALKIVEESDTLSEGTALLSQQRQEANILEAKLIDTQDQAKKWVDAGAVVGAIDAANLNGNGPLGAMTVSATVHFSPDVPSHLNNQEIQIFENIGVEVKAAPQGHTFFVNGRELSREEVKTYVAQSLEQVNQDLGNTVNALKNQQVKVEQTSEKVRSGQDNLSQQQLELKAIESKLQVAENQFKNDLKAYQEIRDKARTQLPPDELEQLDNVLNPMIQRVATEALVHRAETQVIIDAANQHAQHVMSEANEELTRLAKDQQRWKQSISTADNALAQLSNALKSQPSLIKSPHEAAQPSTPQAVPETRRSVGYNPLAGETKSATAPLNPLWLDRHNQELTQKAENKAQAQARNEQSYFQNLQNEKRFNAEIQKSREAIEQERLNSTRKKASKGI